MTPMEATVFEKAKALFACDHSGHDFAHTQRVYRMALHIAEEYPCDKELVALAALLHDADDPKLFKTENFANARGILADTQAAEKTVEQVLAILGKLSFKGSGRDVPDSLEGKIVQDADRLDAIGAIGIARAFAYGGSHGRTLYDPEEPPRENMDEKAYRSSHGSTVNHFYEKLLLLEGLMNTEFAKKLAVERTKFMVEFLGEFLEEWNGAR